MKTAVFWNAEHKKSFARLESNRREQIREKPEKPESNQRATREKPKNKPERQWAKSDQRDPTKKPPERDQLGIGTELNSSRLRASS